MKGIVITDNQLFELAKNATIDAMNYFAVGKEKHEVYWKLGQVSAFAALYEYSTKKEFKEEYKGYDFIVDTITEWYEKGK